MSFSFSKSSLVQLHGVHPLLVEVVYDALETGIMDFSVMEGVRTLARQKELFASGKSTTMKSKHLIQPDGYGHAVDLYPYPVNMAKVNKGDAREFARIGVLAGIMQLCAKRRNVLLRWGGDWDRDGETGDHAFFDGVHFEIIP